jgi:hypothetical protein
MKLKRTRVFEPPIGKFFSAFQAALALATGTLMGVAPVCLAQSSASTPTVEASPPSIQSDDSPAATVTFASGASTQISSQSGYFPLVASNAGEAHTINLQLSAGAPRNLTVQPLDGGAINAGAERSAVSVDGTTSFQFQLGMKAGRYRVLLNDGGVTTLLQFWVADPQNPQANPPTVQAQ